VTIDVIIIGAGIAGASAGYELATTHRVVVLEREEHPGYHTTGRSAALYTENYGNAAIRALTSASRDFFENPPPGFTEHPVLSPRGVLGVATAAQSASFDEGLKLANAVTPGVVVEVERAEALKRFPILNADIIARAMYEPDAMDMDVHAIHQGFLRGLRARGGKVVTGAEVQSLARRNGAWHLTTTAGEFAAPIVINAAGAWADEIGRLAGAGAIGLEPKRRTALTFDLPAGLNPASWPSLHDVDELYYAKPEAGRLLASPADETPSPPCDAQPEEIDIATVIDRLETVITIKISRIARKWAGLRSFVADRTMVAGEGSKTPGFFWLAGQGGYGIQTSPSMGRAIAALVRGQDLPADLLRRGLTSATLAPARLGA
jgi:D-arginine dehydrogenase